MGNVKNINRIVRLSVLAVCFAAFAAVLSCSKKAEKVVDNDEWPAMDSFHTLMADAYHPYKDSGNLAPVKTNIAALVKLADTWSNSPLPARVDNDDVKNKLSLLMAESMSLNEAVSQGQDSTIASSLTQLHEMFHELQEAWYLAKDSSDSQKDH